MVLAHGRSGLMWVSVLENVTRAGQSLWEQLLEHFNQEQLRFWEGKSHHSSVKHPKHPHQSCSDETVAPKPCCNPWCLIKDKQRRAVTHAQKFGCSTRKFSWSSMDTAIPPRVPSSCAYSDVLGLSHQSLFLKGNLGFGSFREWG